ALEEHHAFGCIQQTAGIVHGCRQSTDLTAAEWNQVRAWKAAPELYPAITQRLACEIVTMIGWTFGVARLPADMPAIIITPPQGASAARGGPYAAGLLAREIATQLDRDLVTVFASLDSKRQHGRFASLEAEAFTVQRCPDRLTLIIDDVSTSGRTLQKCRQALGHVGSLAFVWLFYHGGFRTIPEGRTILFDPYAGLGEVLLQCELVRRPCFAMQPDRARCDVIVERYKLLVREPRKGS
ncbi:MAG TPA: hypothetical protein VM223_15260, partial [Planctomycetota bacterium]|nr:hypothetical protein [Planctomycetota bacterium]